MSPRLLAEARHERIMALLRRSGTVSVTELAEELQVAAMTVRRDINRLAELGLVRRVHGGAAAVGRRRDTTGVRGFTLGMIVPLIDQYWNAFAYRAQAEAVSGGARFVLRDAGPGGYQSLPLAKALVSEERADGLILAPPILPPHRGEAEAWLARQSVCTVLVERSAGVALPRVQSIGTDHRLGAAMAVQHLHQLGHRRIALLRPLKTAGGDEIEAGWVAAMAELGLVPGPILETTSGSPRREKLAQAAVDSLRRHGSTAAVVSGDAFALILVQVCRQSGIDVPGALSIVAYGDDVAALCDPPLTTLQPPREQIGRMAVQLLGAHLRGGPEHRPQHVRVAPLLVERSTTASPPD